MDHVTTLNTSSCGLAVLPSTEPEEHITGDSNGLQGAYSVFGFWDRLFLLATLNLAVGSILYSTGKCWNYFIHITYTQKDLPELFFTMVCVYGLCAYYGLQICKCSHKMQSTCYVHFMSYDDQRNGDLIFLHMIPT